MAYVAAAAAIIGAGVQIYGQMSAASDQADAQEKEAKLKGLQADELLQREQINEQVMREREQVSELYTGSDSGTQDSGLGAKLRLQRDLAQNIATSSRESEWKAQMLRMGGEADTRLASDIHQAAGYTAAGTAIGAAGKAASFNYDAIPSTKTTSLPGEPT